MNLAVRNMSTARAEQRIISRRAAIRNFAQVIKNVNKSAIVPTRYIFASAKKSFAYLSPRPANI